jgi:hypothetical protein
MIRFGPKIHYLSELNGFNEINLWEKERKGIFDCNTRLIYHLCKQLSINDAIYER